MLFIFAMTSVRGIFGVIASRMNKEEIVEFEITLPLKLSQKFDI
jgi:hypothetical protein